MSLQVPREYDKKSVKDIQKGFAHGRGQNAYSKTIPKQELTSRSPNGVQRGTLLALANDRSPKGVQRGTLLAPVKIILLVDI